MATRQDPEHAGDRTGVTPPVEPMLAKLADALPAERMQHDGPRRRDLPDTLHALMDEVEVGLLVATAMQPG